MLTMIERDNKASGPTGKNDIIEWIDHILDRKNWTGTDLARKSNLAPSTILRMLNDPDHRFVPSMKTLRKISEGSGYAIPQSVLHTFDEKLEDPTENARPKSMALRDQPPQRRTLKVRSVSSLPASLQAREVGKPEVLAPMLPQLEGDDTAFAFYMPDKSMEPFVPNGCLMYGTLRRDPRAGDVVLITKSDDRSIVRIVKDITDKGFELTRCADVSESLPFDEVKEFAIVAAIVRI